MYLHILNMCFVYSTFITGFYSECADIPAAWTFADVAMQQKEWEQRLKRFIKFNLICLAGLVLNVVILNLVFNLILPNSYIANLIAIAVATFWNFWVNIKLSWRVTQVK